MVNAHAPVALPPPGKDPVPFVQEAGWAPGPFWTGVENLAPKDIRSPERPASSEWLYRLNYPGPTTVCTQYFTAVIQKATCFGCTRQTASTKHFRNIYTGCNRRNGPDFGRVFLRSNYTDITQNSYIQSSMVTEILAREV